MIATQSDHPRLAATLVEMLRKQRILMVETLAKNRATDFADYKYLCGQIDGIDIALNYAKEALKKLEA